MSEIKFILDGRTVNAAPGETILQAAGKAGVEIPSLCYNGKVSRTTSCFVCLVKDKKTGRFLPSCSACPTEGQEIEFETPEVRDMRKTALGLLLSEHTGDCEAPCTVACPAHASVEEYVRAGRDGDFKKSLRIIKERIPLPMSIGRVCPRFCEKDCRKNVTAKPVAINDFKRLAADLYYDEYMEELPPLNGKTVAVVGAGPAGLSAAYFLRRQGYAPTIFEKMPKAGGMLRYGIPQFRLPKETLDRELAHFKKMGIAFEFGKELGRNLTVEELSGKFGAVIVTVGSWAPSAMRIDGEELAEQGIRWLEKIASAECKGCANPGKTVVVGGGNTAMDCARTALRLGGDVTVLYRRTQNEMPAEPLEVHEAMEEGVKFEFLTAPLSLKKNEAGRLVLTGQKMMLGEPDASGRRSPVPVAGSDFDMEIDTVIVAIGQRTVAPAGVPADKRGNVAVSAEELRCGSARLFAAGDCVTGPATVVEAVAAGRKAALAAIDAIEGRPHTEPPVFNVTRGHWRSLAKDDLVVLRDNVSDADRVRPGYISMDRRRTTFEELFPTIPAEKIRKEGERCIECSCTAKGDCKLKKFSEECGAQPDMFTGGKLVYAADTRHPHIIHDRMKCIKCGICVKTCAEIVNKHLLAAMKRGFPTAIGTAFDKGFPSYCSECGACINECPVGALDWRHKE